MSAQRDTITSEDRKQLQALPEGGGYGNVVPFDEIAASERLNVSLDGFEGPLDLLLNFA